MSEGLDIEQLKGDTKNTLEELVHNLEQENGGVWCDLDSINALNHLKEKGFWTPGVDIISTISFTGPVYHYNHYFKQVVRANHHAIGQINNGWIVDLASKPGNRIYEDLEDYKNRSQIKLPQNSVARVFPINLISEKIEI